MKLRVFGYQFDKGSGPMSLKKLKEGIKKGNCRLAVQDYYSARGIYLKPEEILLPGAYKKTGKLIKIFNQDINDFTTNLSQGDIIYAERLRNKTGEIVYKQKKAYKSEDEWILHFHTAIYLGKLDEEILSFLPVKPEYLKGTLVIWHSSFISGGTALWSLEKFFYYYKPVSAKRIL